MYEWLAIAFLIAAAIFLAAQLVLALARAALAPLARAVRPQARRKPRSTFAAIAFLAMFGLVTGPAFAVTPGVSASVVGRVVGSYTGTNGVGVPVMPFDLKGILQFSAGTGIGQADQMYSASTTIAASGSAALTLSSMIDPLGQSIDMAHVKAIVIVASAANTNNVVVGGAAANTFLGPFGSATYTVAVKPGDVFVMTAANGAGWPVTASTADQLKLANSGSGSGVTFQIILIGTST